MNAEPFPVSQAFSSTMPKRWWGENKLQMQRGNGAASRNQQGFSALPKQLNSTSVVEGSTVGNLRACQSCKPETQEYDEKKISCSTTEQKQKPSAKHEVKNGGQDVDLCSICRVGDLSACDNAAAINGCEHLFCFKCIDEWSKHENSCPLCKERFTCIFYLSAGAKTASPKNSRLLCKRVESRSQSPTMEDNRLCVSGADRFLPTDGSEIQVEPPARVSIQTNGSSGEVETLYIAPGNDEVAIKEGVEVCSMSVDPSYLPHVDEDDDEEYLNRNSSFPHPLGLEPDCDSPQKESDEEDATQAYYKEFKYTPFITSITYLSDSEDDSYLLDDDFR